MAQKALETLEHIHASRFKEARKAITAALDKGSDNPQYVVLKALLLVRTGATEEGAALMRQLKAKNVDDAFVTEVIIECLYETGASVEALEVIEGQYNLNPQRGTPREDRLLASYVRAACFSKMQQYCMRAFRESSSPQYYMWSLVANAQHAATPAGARLADLACKQLLKAGDEARLPTAEHVIFFLDFLIAINQPQRVIDAVQLPWVISAFRRDEERLRFQGDALLKLGTHAAALEVHEQLLLLDGDEWTFLRAVLQCRCAAESLSFIQVRLRCNAATLLNTPHPLLPCSCQIQTSQRSPLRTLVLPSSCLPNLWPQPQRSHKPLNPSTTRTRPRACAAVVRCSRR
jgi:tetratricopeptide (TPR) repeat protein